MEALPLKLWNGAMGTAAAPAAPCWFAADLLREASRELQYLRLVRGASRRTARRAVRATAVLIAAAALLGAGPLSRPARAADPHFVNALPFGLSDVGESANPAFADIDGDGDLDAFVGNSDGDTFFFRNTGSAQGPAFAAPRINPFNLSDVDNSAPAFADIDGDGDLDAFIGEARGDTFFFRNTGSATSPAFAAPLTNPFGLAGVGSLSNPVFADFDADGDLDAVVGGGDGRTVFFANTGSAQAPAFAAPIGLVDVGNDSAPTFADIDGDGDLDGFIGEERGDLLFFRNTGTAQSPAFAAPVSNPFGFADVGENNRGDRDSSVAFADIDGDGDLDAFVGASDGNTLFFRNTGSATAPAFAIPLGVPLERSDGWGGFFDIDGDGDLDAIGNAQLPAFAAPLINPFGLADVGRGSAPALVDIDGDGDLDIFIGEAEGRTVLFENRAPCPGDCNQSGQVGIDELIRGVNIALGSLELSACAAMDGSADGTVTIGELIAAVNAALSGCPR